MSEKDWLEAGIILIFLVPTCCFLFVGSVRRWVFGLVTKPRGEDDG